MLSATAIDFNYWSYGLWHWLNNGCDIFIFFFFIIKIVCLNDFFFQGIVLSHQVNIYSQRDILKKLRFRCFSCTRGKDRNVCYLSGSYMVYHPIPCKNSPFFLKLVTWLPVLFSLSTRNLYICYQNIIHRTLILVGFCSFVCLFLSASVISIRTQILVISKPELNEERKKILYF